MKYLNFYNLTDFAKYFCDLNKFQKVVVISSKNAKNYSEMFIEKIKNKCVVFNYLTLQLKNHSELLRSGVFSFVVFGEGEECATIINKIDKESNLFYFPTSNALASFDFSREEYFVASLFYKKSRLDLLMLLEKIINYKWQNLILFKNYELELSLTDLLFKSFNLDDDKKFFNSMFKVSKEINASFKDFEFVLLDDFLKDVKFEEQNNFREHYFYLRIVSIYLLFEMFKNKTNFICDTFRDFENNIDAINSIYNIYFDERINFVLKNCNNNMIIFIEKIINNLNNILKINNNEFNYLINIIKNNAKLSKNDDLLKIAYIYGVFN